MEQYYAELLLTRPRKEWDDAFRKAQFGLRVYIVAYFAAIGIPFFDLFLKSQEALANGSNELPHTESFPLSYVIIFASTIFCAWTQLDILPWMRASKFVHWTVALLLGILHVMSIILILMQAYHENRALKLYKEAAFQQDNEVTSVALEGSSRNLRNYYAELQAVLDSKGSKMAAADYNEDEVRHAWAHGVSPQDFLSMAVRPRLDDSTCRKQFPGLDYSFVESPVVEAVQDFVTEDRTDFVESEGISILVNEENHLDAQIIESKQDQLLEEVSINELERVRVDDVATRLRRVETLFEQNLITAEERERHRAVILSDL